MSEPTVQYVGLWYTSADLAAAFTAGAQAQREADALTGYMEAGGKPEHVSDAIRSAPLVEWKTANE